MKSDGSACLFEIIINSNIAYTYFHGEGLFARCFRYQRTKWIKRLIKARKRLRAGTIAFIALKKRQIPLLAVHDRFIIRQIALELWAARREL